MSSYDVIGEHTSLVEALGRVLANKTDNQKKLAAADAHERHLYVHLEDRAAAEGLAGTWSFPACPAGSTGGDRCHLGLRSSGLDGTAPSRRSGTDNWEHFVMATGEPAPEPDRWEAELDGLTALRPRRLLLAREERFEAAPAVIVAVRRTDEVSD